MRMHRLISILYFTAFTSFAESTGSLSSDSVEEPSSVRVGLPIMAISANDGEVQQLVLQGLEHLMTMNSLSAIQCFERAAKLDPDCLMAHWGMAMALYPFGPEKKALKIRALENLQALLGEQSPASEREKQYAALALTLVLHGSDEAYQLVGDMSSQWPRDPILGMIAHHMKRSLRQVDENDFLPTLLKNAPDLYIGHFLTALNIHDQTSDEQRLICLDHAKRCVELRPDYAQSHYLAGVIYYALGQFPKAIESFSQSMKLLEKETKEGNHSSSDSINHILGKIYLAQCYFLLGDEKKSQQESTKIAELKFDKDQNQGVAVLAHKWMGADLPLRLKLAHWEVLNEKEWKALSDKAEKTLKDLNPELLGIHQDFAQAKLATQSKQWKRAQLYHDSIKKRLSSLSDLLSLEVNPGEEPYIRRAIQLGVVYMMRIQSMTYVNSQASWLKNACDAQQGAFLFTPPDLPYPQEFLLAKAYLNKRENAQAIECLEEGLKKFPNNPYCVELLKKLRKQSK